jgi:hypothetical protein
MEVYSIDLEGVIFLGRTIDLLDCEGQQRLLVTHSLRERMMMMMMMMMMFT